MAQRRGGRAPRGASQTAERSLVEVRASERHAELAQVERLVEAVRRLDAARSLTDALDVLVDAAAKEAPRVAVFMVRGTRVAGLEGRGPAGRHRPEARGHLGRRGRPASRAPSARRRPSTTSDSPDPALMTTPFGVLPTDAAGLAIALRVGGEPVAVVYADDAADERREVPSAWPEAVELLARHAARCLEVLTVARVSQPVAAAPASAAADAAAVSALRAAGPRARGHQRHGRRCGAAVREAAGLRDQAVSRGGGLAGPPRRQHPAAPAPGNRPRAHDSTTNACPTPSGRAPTTSARSWCARSPTATAGCWARPEDSRRVPRRLPLVILTALAARRRRARPPGRRTPPPDARQPGRPICGRRRIAPVPANLDEFWLVPPAGWRPRERGRVERGARPGQGVRPDCGRQACAGAAAHPRRRRWRRRRSPATRPTSKGWRRPARSPGRREGDADDASRGEAGRGALADAVNLRLAELSEAERDFAAAAAHLRDAAGGEAGVARRPAAAPACARPATRAIARARRRPSRRCATTGR